MHPIQMVDLKRQYHKIKAEVDEAVINEIANLILKGIFNFMKPNQKWEERHPFD